LALLDLQGLGPKRARLLNERLRIRNLSELAAAAKAGKICELPGFGAQTEKHLLQEAEKRAAAAPRLKRPVAEDIAGPLLSYLRAAPGVRQAAVAGSYRRCKETIGDLDIVVWGERSLRIIERFVGYEDVAQVLSRGPTRSTIVLHNGVQIDLRVVSEANYGAGLQYFTGSKAHKHRIAANRGDLWPQAQRVRAVPRRAPRVAGDGQSLSRRAGPPYWPAHRGAPGL
jgi:DNA polymerase (family X)